MVERAERLGVALQTAYRLYEGGSDAELRTALVLLDSAAELLLFAGVEQTMQFWSLRERLAEYALEDKKPVKVISLPSPVKEKDIPDSEPWVLSKGAKAKVEREFGKKLELLEFTGEVPSEYVVALASLHEYRNAAYHRDTLRLETLRTSVELHFYLTAQLLRLLKPGMYYLPHGPEVERIAKSLGVRKKVVKAGEPALRRALADFILDRLHLEERGVQAVLADNLAARLDTMNEQLEFIGDMWAQQDTTIPDVIRRLQEEEVFVTLETLRSRHYPVTPKTLEKWRDDAEEVRSTPAPLDAFNLYAGIEQAMKSFERETEGAFGYADQELQRQIDEARGK